MPCPLAPTVELRRALRLTIGCFALFLGLALALVFPGVLLGYNTFFYRDFGVLAYPTIFHQHASFWRGELPLWNPNSNCGVPFLAQWGTTVLYPFSILYLLLPLPWSLNVFCLAHLFLGGLGMFCLAGEWTKDRFAASVAGTAFVFNGVTLSSLMWPNYTVALGWMPWVVLLVRRAWGPGSGWRAVTLASLGAALQLLSGVPEIVLLTWLCILALALVQNRRLFVSSERQAPPKILLPTLAIILLASGLTAAQLLPFFDLLAHSQRNAASATAKWTLPTWDLGNLVLPLFRCAQSRQGIFFQLGQEFFGSTYLGVLPLALAFLAIWNVRRPIVWVWATLAALATVLALGDNGGLYGLVRRLWPALGFVRYPVKFVILVAFALPLLAACGVASLQTEAQESRGLARRRWLAILCGLIVCLGALVWVTQRYPTPYDQWAVVWRSAACRLFVLLAGATVLLRVPGSWRYAFLLLLVVDALVGVPNKTPVLPAPVLAPGLWQLQNKVPPPRFGEGRVMISPAAEDRLLLSQVGDLEADLVGKHLALWSHLNLLEQIPKVNGSSTLQIREEKEIESLLYAATNTDIPSLTLFLNVTYATAPGQVVEWTRQPRFLPLITAGQQPVFLPSTAVLNSLTNSGFDPAHTVLLANDERQSVTVSHPTQATVSEPRFSPQHIECVVQVTEPSLVVLAQSYYHPWHAFVDGRRVALLHANHAFQALEVPAGRHRVQWIYQDRAFWTGTGISLLTLLVCLGLLWRPGKSTLGIVESAGG